MTLKELKDKHRWSYYNLTGFKNYTCDNFEFNNVPACEHSEYCKNCGYSEYHHLVKELLLLEDE